MTEFGHCTPSGHLVRYHQGTTPHIDRKFAGTALLAEEQQMFTEGLRHLCQHFATMEASGRRDFVLHVLFCPSATLRKAVTLFAGPRRTSLNSPFLSSISTEASLNFTLNQTADIAATTCFRTLWAFVHIPAASRIWTEQKK